MSVDYEPDWSAMKEVAYACGHLGTEDRLENDPSPGEVCWRCEPCPACGEKYSDCTCPVIDPFGDD